MVGNEGLQHGAPRHAQDVRGHAGQLDVGTFQDFLHPVDQGRPFPHEISAVARQLAQFALADRRNETGPQQPMPQQFGQPFRIVEVGLAARDRFDVVRIDQPHLKGVLQNVEDRLPVFAGALYRHVRHPVCQQPVREQQQIGSHRPKGACFLAQTALGIRHNDGRHHGLLMHIQARTMRVNDVHPNLLGRISYGWRGYPKSQNLTCVLPRLRERQLAVPAGIPVRLLFRLMAPDNKRPLCQPCTGNDTTFSCVVVNAVHDDY